MSPHQLLIHDEQWYNKGRVGHDPLECFMKFLINDAKLSNNAYTNHSIRATVITNLNEKGFKACHIIAVTGHKLESTIKQNAKRCPETKKRQMSHALADEILPKKVPKIVPNYSASISESATAVYSPPANSRSDLNFTQEPLTDTKTFDFNATDTELLPIDKPDDDILEKFINDLEKKYINNTTFNHYKCNKYSQ